MILTACSTRNQRETSERERVSEIPSSQSKTNREREPKRRQERKSGRKEGGRAHPKCIRLHIPRQPDLPVLSFPKLVEDSVLIETFSTCVRICGGGDGFGFDAGDVTKEGREESAQLRRSSPELYQRVLRGVERVKERKGFSGGA